MLWTGYTMPVGLTGLLLLLPVADLDDDLCFLWEEDGSAAVLSSSLSSADSSYLQQTNTICKLLGD